MLICTLMDVNIPADMDEAERAGLVKREADVAKELQAAGKMVHLWRVSGRPANVSIWDVADNQEFHDCVMSLPLFKYLTITVIPLNKHPSSIVD